MFLQLTDDPDAVVLGVLSSFIQSCVWDISQSDVQTVEQTIYTFSFYVEITSIFSVEITVILNELYIIICPGQPMCNGHGICDNAVCVCETGINFFCYLLLSFISQHLCFTCLTKIGLVSLLQHWSYLTILSVYTCGKSSSHILTMW